MEYVCLEMCACAYTSRRLDFRFQMYHLFYRTGAQAFQSLYFSSFTAFLNHAWRLITRSRAIRRSRYPREIHKIVSRSVAKINARLANVAILRSLREISCGYLRRAAPARRKETDDIYSREDRQTLLRQACFLASERSATFRVKMRGEILRFPLRLNRVLQRRVAWRMRFRIFIIATSSAIMWKNVKSERWGNRLFRGAARSLT